MSETKWTDLPQWVKVGIVLLGLGGGAGSGSSIYNAINYGEQIRELNETKADKNVLIGINAHLISINHDVCMLRAGDVQAERSNCERERNRRLEELKRYE